MQTPFISAQNKHDIILSNEFSDMTIRYRHYTPQDSPAVIKLEDEASQHPTIFGLLRSGTIFRDVFETKSKDFKDYIILVAEATHKSGDQAVEICGGVCLGLKEIYFAGKARKSGALYDLRVSDRYQRKGIGTTLCTMLEKVAKARGCEFIYLSVNLRNDKAIFLYNKLGYEKVSNRRILRFNIPEQNNNVAPSIKTINHGGLSTQLYFERLTRSDTIKYYTEAFQGQDLAFVNWEEMIDTPAYLGTYAVRTADSKNIAGMSLYRIKKTGFMGLKRLFVDASYYNQLWLIALGLTFFYLLFGGLLQKLGNWPNSWGIGDFWAKVVGYGLMGIPLWLFTMGYLKINKLITAFSGYSIRGRCTGPFMINRDDELAPHLLSFLSERVGTVAANEDFTVCTYNCDSEDIFASRIPGISSFGGRTLFMGKLLTDEESLKNYKTSKHLFFDPRDL